MTLAASWADEEGKGIREAIDRGSGCWLAVQQQVKGVSWEPEEGGHGISRALHHYSFTTNHGATAWFAGLPASCCCRSGEPASLALGWTSRGIGAARAEEGDKGASVESCDLEALFLVLIFSDAL
jgi:hypothetical protein